MPKPSNDSGRKTVRHDDSVDDLRNRQTIDQINDEQKAAVFESAKKILAYREAFNGSRKGGPKPQGRTASDPSEPIRELFKTKRNDVLEARLCACAFWLSWKNDLSPEAT